MFVIPVMEKDKTHLIHLIPATINSLIVTEVFLKIFSVCVRVCVRVCVCVFKGQCILECMCHKGQKRVVTSPGTRATSL